MKFKLFDYLTVRPLNWLGFDLTGPFWDVHLDTLLYTWAGMAVLFFAVFLLRKYYFSYDHPAYAGAEYLIEYFGDMCAQSIGYFRYDYFSLLTTLFIFTLITSLVGLLPYMDEATKDVNTTFALALVSFVYTVWKKIARDGLLGYLDELSGPHQLGRFRFVMMPLEVVGQVSKIISMSFRLFGNILGGAVVFSVFLGMVYKVRIGYIALALIYALVSVGISYFGFDKRSQAVRKSLLALDFLVFAVTYLQLFFGIFEALIQAFVVAMLTMAYLSQLINHDNDREAKGTIW